MAQTDLLITPAAATPARRPARWVQRVSILSAGAACLVAVVVGTSQMPISSARAEDFASNNQRPVVSAPEKVVTISAPTSQPSIQTISDEKAADQAEPVLASDIQPANVELIHEDAPSAEEQIVAAPKSRVLWMEVTAYCSCRKCCGEDAQGLTASGKPVSYNKGRFVAADTSVLPFGTKLSIPGYYEGQQVEVIDRGGAIKGHKLDVYFSSHTAAKKWGRKMIPVIVHERD